MDATIKLVTKTHLYQHLWLKTVTGFDQAQNCEKCLLPIGRPSPLISFPRARPEGFPAGHVVEGLIEDTKPFVYLCGVAFFGGRPHQNVQVLRRLDVLMVRDKDIVFTYEDEDVCVLVTGMKRLPIDPVPGADVFPSTVPQEFHTCPNWRAGWHCFPDDRKPLNEVPGENSTNAPHAARGRRKPPGTPEVPSSGT